MLVGAINSLKAHFVRSLIRPVTVFINAVWCYTIHYFLLNDPHRIPNRTRGNHIIRHKWIIKMNFKCRKLRQKLCKKYFPGNELHNDHKQYQNWKVHITIIRVTTKQVHSIDDALSSKLHFPVRNLLLHGFHYEWRVVKDSVISILSCVTTLIAHLWGMYTTHCGWSAWETNMGRKWGGAELRL